MKNIFIILFAVSVAVMSCSKDRGEEEKIRLAYLQGDLHHLACWIALEKNYFKDEGIDVEVAGIFKAGPEEMSAFAAGVLDAGYVGQAPATTAVANRTADVVVVAQANKEGSAIVVKKNGKISKMAELAGKTIAVPGHSTVQDFLLRKALAKYGIDERSVKIMVLKPPEMAGALKTDQIDAFIAWEPYPAKAVTMGAGQILAASCDIWKGHPCCVLAVDSQFFKKYPDKVRALVNAHMRATDFIRDNTLKSAAIAVKYTGMDEKSVGAAMKNIEYDYNPAVSGEIEYIGFLNKMGYIKVDDPKKFTEKFINTAFVK